MKVELIAYTNPYPDNVCDLATRTCTSEEFPEMEMAVNKLSALRHALDSGHESVAEHAVFTFAVTGISRVSEIQLVRHRLASYSIQSGRYCSRDPTNYVIPFNVFEIENDDIASNLMDMITEFDKTLKILDECMKEAGISEENRRYFYPQGIKTNIVFTMNARELRHFFSERLCNRAQWEIRELAEKMLELVKPIAPELFDGVGPKCEMLGRCPERKGCGRHE